MPADARAAQGPDGTPSEARYRDGTYLGSNPSWHAEDSAWKARQVLGMLRRHGVAPRTVAEVGCGAGEVVAELARHLTSAEFVGYDVSHDAQAFWAARASDRVDFRLADFTGVDAHYDLLLCLDVFEHVEDYFGFLRAIHGRADRAVFHIPLDICILNIVMGGIMGARQSVGHLHYFTVESALATLADCGYDILDWRYTTLLKDEPGLSAKGRALLRSRRLLNSVSPDWGQRILGGSSIIVLAR